MLPLPIMGVWSIVWPFVRGALAAILRPALDPQNWIGLAVLAAACYGYGYFKGDAHGDAQCNAAAIQAELDRLKLEQKLAADAEAQEDKDQAELQAEEEERRKKDAETIEELRKRPDQCLLGDDAGRL